MAIQQEKLLSPTDFITYDIMNNIVAISMNALGLLN